MFYSGQEVCIANNTSTAGSYPEALLDGHFQSRLSGDKSGGGGQHSVAPLAELR